jgi:hypothetical protein
MANPMPIPNPGAAPEPASVPQPSAAAPAAPDPTSATAAPETDSTQPNPAQDPFDATADPLAIIDQITDRLVLATNDVARQPIPDDLPPHQIELALLRALRGAARTTLALARLQDKAADHPTSSLYAQGLADLQETLTATGHRLARLTARRQPAQIPWTRQQGLLERQEQAMAHLVMARVRLLEQRQRAAQRRQARAQRQQEQELRDEWRAHEAERKYLLRQWKRGDYSAWQRSPRTPAPAAWPAEPAAPEADAHQDTPAAAPSLGATIPPAPQQPAMPASTVVPHPDTSPALTPPFVTAPRHDLAASFHSGRPQAARLRAPEDEDLDEEEAMRWRYAPVFNPADWPDPPASAAPPADQRSRATSAADADAAPAAPPPATSAPLTEPPALAAPPSAGRTGLPAGAPDPHHRANAAPATPAGANAAPTAPATAQPIPSAPPSTSHAARPAHAPQPAPAAHPTASSAPPPEALVRIFDPHSPTGWRLVPHHQVPTGAQILAD